MLSMTDSPIELLVLLRPLAPLHLGQGRELNLSEDRIRSDTLWGALFAVAVDQGRRPLLEVLLTPGFFISSSFPVWRNIYFWPRPFLEMETGSDPSQRKKWRNITFVSDGVLKKLVRTNDRVGFDFDETIQLSEGCLLLKEEIEGIPPCGWLQGLGATTGNVVDRLTSMADLFDRTDLYVNTAAGVRIGFRVIVPESRRKDLEATIAELGMRGIGGERSIGKGAYEIADIRPCAKSPGIRSTGKSILLSLYHPTKEEVNTGVLESAAYDLEVRGGWVDRSGSRKMRIRMLKEGSIFNGLEEPPLGDVVDVRPSDFPHAVYRYGRAYTFPLEEI